MTAVSNRPDRPDDACRVSVFTQIIRFIGMKLLFRSQYMNSAGVLPAWRMRCCAALCLRIIPLLLLLLFATNGAHAASSSHCVYNKTKDQQISIAATSNTKSMRTLAAGTHFCCEPGDQFCPASVAIPSWLVEAKIRHRGVTCAESNAQTAGISLKQKNAYLLVRDVKHASAPPTATSQIAKGARAPLEVDVIAADGQVVTTFPCTYLV
jgi:hypothetical protein